MRRAEAISQDGGKTYLKDRLNGIDKFDTEVIHIDVISHFEEWRTEDHSLDAKTWIA